MEWAIASSKIREPVMKINKKWNLFLAMTLFIPQIRADNSAVWGILGTSVLVLGGFASALYFSCRIAGSSGGYKNATDFQNAMQSYADQTVATKYADSYNALQQASGMSTPTSADYQDQYPQDWAQACKDFISNNISRVSGINAKDFNSFVDQWASSQGSYGAAIESISNAVSTGGGSGMIGKWSVPDGYNNTLDYMIKNNINSPETVASLRDYMSKSGSGYFPEKYTPGDVPPPVVPDVPNVPINTSGMLPSTGTGQSANYVESYNNILTQYNSLAQNMSIDSFNNMLLVQYQSLQSQLKTVQQDINDAISSGQNDVSELKIQEEALQAKSDATAKAYEEANNGNVIPEE